MTTDINTITLTGRLTKDAEKATTKNGTSIGKFSIATNEYWKGEKDDTYTNFFDCELKGREGILPYLTKGAQVAISGTLRQSRWEKDGRKDSKVVVRIIELRLMRSSDSKPAAPARMTGPEGFPDDDIF